MPKKQFKATVTKEYRLIYNPESPDFKEAFESYKSCIDKKATIQSMLQHVTYYVDKYGAGRMVEGVGHVKVGQATPDPYSGIDLYDHEPDGEIEVISNDFI